MRIGGIMLTAAVAALLLAAPVARAQEAPPAAGGTETNAEVKPMDTSAGQPAAENKGAGEVQKDKPAGNGGGGGAGMWPLLVMLGGFFLLYFWMTRGKHKEQKRRAEMLSALKKGDKITTIGGAIGTVVEVRNNDVTVKVDESANVRMRFARWAIRGVGDAAVAENQADAQKEVKKE